IWKSSRKAGGVECIEPRRLRTRVRDRAEIATWPFRGRASPGQAKASTDVSTLPAAPSQEARAVSGAKRARIDPPKERGRPQPSPEAHPQDAPPLGMSGWASCA